MKKERGYIYIPTIFVALIILVGAFFIFKSIDNEENLYADLEDKIQGSYFGESLVNIAFSRDEYNKLNAAIRENYNKFGEIDYSLNIESWLKDGSIESVKYSVLKNGEYPMFKINFLTKYKDIPYKTVAKGSIINKLFNEESGILSEGKSGREFTEIRDTLNFEKVKSSKFSWKYIINLDYGNYIMKNSGYYFNIYELIEEDTQVEKLVHSGNIALEGLYNLKGKYSVEEKVNFRGIIFLDGDIYLNDNMDFKGILIHKSGNIVNQGGELKVEGLIIDLGANDYSNIQVKYDKNIVLRYVRAIESMVKIKVSTIIKSEQNYFE